ncbi:glycosyltransferase family 2 protein [Siculibacillus lacustris]|nr:glycosyltransferase family 2 protein [Siculibacillus lacustris]
MSAAATSATVSVVIAVHQGEATLARAVASLVAQTRPDWEAILVSDDGVDYRAVLAGQGIVDPRVVEVSTGRIGAGCTRARNVGLAAVRGGFVTRLDADDTFAPDRLERLVPIAEARGAALDGVEMIDDDGGRPLWTAFPPDTPPGDYGAEALGRRNSPFIPLVARALAPPWFEDVDISEDVLFLFALEERLGGPLPVIPDPLYRYHVRAGSMCHGDDGAARADASYRALDEALAAGVHPGIGPAAAARARAVFAAKRQFNRRFAEAVAAGRTTNFQAFCAETARAEV